MSSLLTIVSNNNHGALTLAAGNDKEAVNILRDSLPLLVDICHANSHNESSRSSKTFPARENDLLEEDIGSANGMAYCYMVTPVMAKPMQSDSVYHISFVYLNPFVLSTSHSWTYNKESIALASAVVLYNMGLAFHRSALSLSCDHEVRRSSILRAKALYMQSIGLVVRGINLGREESTALAIAAYSNLAQIYLDILFDCESAKEYLVALSYVTHAGRTSNQMIVLDVGFTPMSFFRKRDWEGFLANLFILDSIDARSAAAA